MMRLLGTGADGQVGSAIVRRASDNGIDIIATTRTTLNLEDDASMQACVSAAMPNVIINTAAYTAVDQAESEPDRARRINADGAAALARAAAEIGCPLIHFSTDYVFDGTGTTPWQPHDKTAPCNTYGLTKLEGEHGVRAAWHRSCILRTSWVYDGTGRNFLRTMLRLGRDRDELSIVDDQHGAPNHADRLAQWVIGIAGDLLSAPDNSALFDVFHLSSSGETTWFGFAEKIFSCLPPDRRPRLIPVPTSAYPTPAQRPHNSRLNCAATFARFNIEQTSWETDVERAVQTALAQPEASNAAGK